MAEGKGAIYMLGYTSKLVYTNIFLTWCSSSVSPQKPAMKSEDRPRPTPSGLSPAIMSLAFLTNCSYAWVKDRERKRERKNE